MADEVRVERRGEVVQISLDRPAAANAVTPPMIAALIDAVDDAARSEADRAILLTTTGRHFCAGVDLEDINRDDQTPRRTGDLHRRMAAGSNRLLRMLHEVQLPIVGAVRGAAVGFGCALALSCDHVVVTADAIFRTPFVQHGFTPDSGTTFLLPRLVGVARAKEMLLLGRAVDGETAERWGLVNEVADDADLESRAMEVASELAGGATVALGLARALVHRALTSDFARAMADEGLAVELAVRSADFKEGMAAFRERRPPRYEGR